MTKHKTDDSVAIVASIVDSNQNQLAVFDSLVVVTAHLRAYNSRYGDFRADSDNRSLYPLRMRTVHRIPALRLLCGNGRQHLGKTFCHNSAMKVKLKILSVVFVHSA